MTAGAAQPPRPETPPFAGLPDLPALRELQGRPKWVAWDYVWKPEKGKWDKPPICARDGGPGSTTNPETWTSYAHAADFTKARRKAGVGYVLSPDDDESGIDLDKCRDPETGILQAWAQVAVDFGETYAEVSPSGRGLRFFVRGAVDGRKVDAAQVEIYTTGRYLTVTGRHVPGTPTDIRPAPRLITYLQERADHIRAAQKDAADLAREQERKKAEKRAQAGGDAPRAETTSERARKAAGGGYQDRDRFWRTVNDRALASLGAWVTTVFPGARQSDNGAWRVQQRDLGEGYEEDLSLHPDGIRDFGCGDMGDARDGARTPIDIVQDYLPATDATAAAMWLCERLGIRPEDIDWRGGERAREDARPRDDGGAEQADDRRDRREAPREIPLHWHRDADPNADRAWTVREMIPEKGKGLLSGQWGTYKTFIVLDLSGCVMAGEPFAGRRVLRRGGVLFIAPEGAFEIPTRLRGLVAGKLAGAAMTQAAAGERLIDPDDLPFAWIEECPRLVTPEAAAQLIAVADRAARELHDRYGLPLVLIVIDTVAAGAGFEDENSAAESQKVMGGLERLSHHTGAFVLGVDHFGKAVETGTRGSSAKEAAADAVLAALATKDEAGNVSNMRLAVRKVRGARTGQEIPYGIEVVEIGTDRWGDPLTTCVVQWQTEREATEATAKGKDRWTAGLRVFRTALIEALDTHGIRAWPFGGTGPEHRAVPLERVRVAFYAIYPASGETEAQRSETKRRQFNRMVTQAQGKDVVGSIELNGVDHLWLKPEPGRPAD